MPQPINTQSINPQLINSPPTHDAAIDAFRQQLFTLARSLKIDPWVPENQVTDRVALSFRKLLNFLAQHAESSVAGLLAYPAAAEAQATLSDIMQHNLYEAQQEGVFRRDIAADLLGQFFTGLLIELAKTSVDAPARHQQSLAATRLFCEGAWLRGES